MIKITKPKIGKIDNANVYGYDFNGKLLWQIKDMNLVHEEHYYTSMHIINNELYLYNISGVEVKINPKTGEILSKELIK